MANKQSKKATGMTDGQKVGIGAGVAAAALAAAAGTYFLYGSKKAEANRRKAKSWMLRAKAEILDGIERAQDMTQADYETLVKTAVSAYAGLQDVSKTDLASFAKDMKAEWGNLTKAAKPKKTAAKKSVKKTTTKAKSVAKKASTKAKKTTQ